MRDLKPQVVSSLFLIAVFSMSSPARSADSTTGRDPCTKGEALLVKKDFKAALMEFDKALKQHPDYARAHFFRGIAVTNLGNFQKAIQSYNKALALKPNVPLAIEKRAYCYSELAQYDKAIADYTKAIALNAKAMNYHRRALLFERKGARQQALDDYSTALSLDPNLSDAYFNRALIYENLGQPEKAIADFGKVISVHPEDSDAFVNRANNLAYLGQNQEAINDYNKAIILKPDLAIAYVNRATLYEALGKIALAEQDRAAAAKLGYQSARQPDLAQLPRLGVTDVSITNIAEGD